MAEHSAAFFISRKRSPGSALRAGSAVAQGGATRNEKPHSASAPLVCLEKKGPIETQSWLEVGPMGAASHTQFGHYTCRHIASTPCRRPQQPPPRTSRKMPGMLRSRQKILWSSPSGLWSLGSSITGEGHAGIMTGSPALSLSEHSRRNDPPQKIPRNVLGIRMGGERPTLLVPGWIPAPPGQSGHP